MLADALLAQLRQGGARPVTHLFIAGPNVFAFLLGQNQPASAEEYGGRFGWRRRFRFSWLEGGDGRAGGGLRRHRSLQPGEGGYSGHSLLGRRNVARPS